MACIVPRSLLVVVTTMGGTVHGCRGRAPKTPTLLDVLWVMWGRLKLQNHKRSLPRVLDSNLRVAASPTRVSLGVASCQSEILSLKKVVWRQWPPCLRFDLMVREVVSRLCQNAPFPAAAARLFGGGTAVTPSRKLPMVWQRLRGQGREREEWVSLFPLLRVVILRTAIAAEEAAVSEIRRTGGTNASRLTCQPGQLASGGPISRN